MCLLYWGTALPARMGRVQFPMMSLELFIDIILSDRTVVVGSTQPLTEMSTRDIPWRVEVAVA